MGVEVLYDAQISPLSTPDTFISAGSSGSGQPWFNFATTNLNGARQEVRSESSTSGASLAFTRLSTDLDSSAPLAVLAGYSNHGPFFGNLVNGGFPSLERTKGFTLSLQLRLNREDHSGDRNDDGVIDRGGISLTLITSDKLGIEVVFWKDEIWVQSDGSSTPLFTHNLGERVFRNTTGWITYQLRVQGDDYSLLAADETSAESIVLQGRLKDYGRFDHVAAGLPYDLYQTPNFIFLGDNTRSASGSFDLSRITLTFPDLGPEDPAPATEHTSLIGPGSHAATPGRDTFRFLFPDRFGPQGADTITNFMAAAGDRLVFSRSFLPGVSQLTLKTVRASKSFRRALRSRTPLIYRQSTGELFFNANGKRPGCGNEGGLFAILEGSPPLSGANVELLSL